MKLVEECYMYTPDLSMAKLLTEEFDGFFIGEVKKPSGYNHIQLELYSDKELKIFIKGVNFEVTEEDRVLLSTHVGASTKMSAEDCINILTQLSKTLNNVK